MFSSSWVFIRAEETPRVTVGELAERLQLRHHSTVGLVDRLVAEKLVIREPSAEDRREVLIQLTHRGEKILEKLAASTANNFGGLGRKSVSCWDGSAAVKNEWLIGRDFAGYSPRFRRRRAFNFTGDTTTMVLPLTVRSFCSRNFARSETRFH